MELIFYVFMVFVGLNLITYGLLYYWLKRDEEQDDRF